MPDARALTALDVLIGLGFVYFLLSLVISALTEAVAGLFQLRWKTLRRGLGELLLYSREECEQLVKDVQLLEDVRGELTMDQRAKAQKLGLITPGQAADQSFPVTGEALISKLTGLKMRLEHQQRRTGRWKESWGEFQENPRVQALFKRTGTLGGRGPSYIPPRTFVLTMLDTLAPPEGA